MLELRDIKNKTLRRSVLVIGYPALFVGAVLFGLRELMEFTVYIWKLDTEDE